jgi:hypothetical protein
MGLSRQQPHRKRNYPSQEPGSCGPITGTRDYTMLFADTSNRNGVFSTPFHIHLVFLISLRASILHQIHLVLSELASFR